MTKPLVRFASTTKCSRISLNRLWIHCITCGSRVPNTLFKKKGLEKGLYKVLYRVSISIPKVWFSNKPFRKVCYKTLPQDFLWANKWFCTQPFTFVLYLSTKRFYTKSLRFATKPCLKVFCWPTNGFVQNPLQLYYTFLQKSFTLNPQGLLQNRASRFSVGQPMVLYTTLSSRTIPSYQKVLY